MSRQEIRLRRVRELVAAEGGLARFAERLGISNSQVSQFAGKNPTRNIGNAVAAKIEAAYGKPAGWLDIDDSAATNDADLVVRSADGTLHVIQMKAASRILSELDDASLSTALGFLQSLLKRQKEATAPEGGNEATDTPEVSFTVGRRSAPARRHGAK
ncbi:helix-turn-helix transcriptional regulator [Cupriavidus taiwanensis]|uniref:helix-turn-helix domain-containing protein n=1 Tax=Cupriavidus taiwanensis TaxID=164546 RepID=UPI001573B6FA|nr:helix-turn-helix transcriptional regulator [Cupriavidus taiwanensis]NSX14993.1 helix-turn-helix transcriptional regulator [Cupriavidus taiwanensis]